MQQRSHNSSGGSFRQPKGRFAFTLIEMLLVLALIGVFATLFVVNASSFGRQTATQAVEAQFWNAVREARTRAIVDRQAQAVRYDDEAVAFVVENIRDGAQSTFSVSREDWPPDLEVAIALKKRVDRSQFTLVRGELVDLREIPEVRFFPDGACVPFVADFRVGDTERQIEIDPWTGAELLGSDAR
jgi:type II secretion system protein H